MKLPSGQECFFVALEGPDRLGKSTQASLIPEILSNQGLRVSCCKIPYNDGFSYSRIYEMLFSGEAEREPIVFQTLQGMNRMFFQTNVLPGLCDTSDIVIVDRWNLSTEIYGYCNGVSSVTTDVILRGVVNPDLTLVFQGTPLQTEGEEDVYEKNKVLQNQVHSLYEEAVVSGAEPRITINANRPRHEVTASILQEITSHYTSWFAKKYQAQ
jgi:thymidylate kinase